MSHKSVFFVAMDEEIAGIFDLEQCAESYLHGFKVYTNSSSIIILTGVGKTQAAAAAQLALQSFSAQRYINLGLAGAFNRRLDLGQVVSVTNSQFFDVDLTAFGHQPGQIYNCQIDHYQLANLDHSLHEVKSVTGDSFLNQEITRAKIFSTFHPDIVDMELASIAHIFHRHSKLEQLAGVKVVSDYADSSGTTDFQTLMQQALTNMRQWIDSQDFI